MKKFLLILTLVILGCSAPVQLIVGTPTPIPSEVPTPTATLIPVPTPPTTAELGTDKNPLILALAPSSRNDEDVLTAGETIAAQLESLTGFKIVAVAPTTELELVEDFAKAMPTSRSFPRLDTCLHLRTNTLLPRWQASEMTKHYMAHNSSSIMIVSSNPFMTKHAEKTQQRQKMH